MPLSKFDIDRLYDRISPEPMSGCWLWTASLTTSGYGHFMVGSKNYKAHRMTYQTRKGEVPRGMQLDHLCRVRCCVNPDHLEPVTCRTNLLRGTGASATNHKKTACKHGHSLEHCYEWTDSKNRQHRICRECRNAIHRRRRKLAAM